MQANELPVRDRPLDFLIVGSGFAGLGMAIRLLQRGERHFVVLEKADRLGGVWRDNTYPGCACDVPAHLYSYSFEPQPRWSRLFAKQPEIRSYLDHCAEKYGVLPFLRFGKHVSTMAFNEATLQWRVTTADGEVLYARHVVLAVGGLHVPAFPRIAGAFGGTAFHTAKWNNTYDFRGKRVAVIGTGASAIQVLPRLVSQTKALTLFQRTAPWVLPKLDRRVTEVEQQRFTQFPWVQRGVRWSIYTIMELLGLGYVFHPRWLAVLENVSRWHLRRQISDAALRAKLTPNFRLGCKRILMSNDYYPAVAQVQVETRTIARLTERGVETDDGRLHEVDVLVYATGFEVTNGLQNAAEIRGRGGVTLAEAWKHGMSAHLGTTVSGFPNLFLLTGPNTGLGSNSIVFMIEAQIDHVLHCVDAAKKEHADAVEVRADAQAKFQTWLRDRMKATVWATGCQSWYLDAFGNNTTLWPGLPTEFWLRTRRLKAEEYVFSVRAQPLPS